VIFRGREGAIGLEGVAAVGSAGGGAAPPAVSAATSALLAAPGGIALGRCAGGGGAWPGARAPEAFPSSEAASKMALTSPPIRKMNPVM
jgi:hypothetical protein